MNTPEHIAYIGLGANLATPIATLHAALAALRRLPDCRFSRASCLYRSAPLGLLGQPDFYNAVAALHTTLTPKALLAVLFAVEAQFGRVRSIRNAPRILDLDLLLFDDRILADPELTVPHPRMHERAFVLRPLTEIAPGLVIPGHGPALALLAQCADQRIDPVDQDTLARALNAPTTCKNLPHHASSCVFSPPFVSLAEDSDDVSGL